MSHFKEFSLLHQEKSPLLIGNVWDIQSALMFEKMNFKALGTSSAAIASSLGYEDGEEVSFDELYAVVKSIASKVAIPLTVDIEAGYSRKTSKIIENIVLLSQLGVIGVNLEDSIVEDGNRKLLDSKSFAETVKSIKQYLLENNINVFLNIRTDPYIVGLESPLNESILRAKFYGEAGADGIFVPCILDKNDIKHLVDSVSLPVNVMAMANLPDFSVLEKMGVKRISMGPFVYSKINEKLRDIVGEIQDKQSFNGLFTEV
ncbi:Probable carboxyvinyl-carboxyphosphonate phosphorylmutase [hydrothermal vent metagenome]|uniref:Probable carboxyvinyl-carboxyphosphonate phosphorylmutase n=1 Tax=hydrothermal vent metagenome TaxID=652676 RepID=A0A3B1A4E0_9ZZZZ